MSSTFTVQVRSLVAVAAVALLAVAAYLVGAAGGASPAANAAGASPPEQTDMRTITMRGAGDATGIPDELSFHLTVATSAPDVSTALSEANARMRRVQHVLLGDGVRRKDMQTTGLDIHPIYRYSNDAPPTITGYGVSENVGVLVRALKKAGAVLVDAVHSGRNSVRVHGVGLQIGDQDSLLARARRSAAADATAKAREYAAATGQKLGQVVSIKEVSASRPRPLPVYARLPMADAAKGMVPIRAGSSKTSVTVQVVWSLR